MVQAPAQPQLHDARPRPFMKWAGGKTQLLPEILRRFPAHYRRYHEPFVGGGAVFFALGPECAFLSDVNVELVDTYRMIRDDVAAVIRALKRHRAEEEHYYEVRAQQRAALGEAQSAARTIFLNRTCFNGLYRVNRKGQFNVPFGRYSNPTICNDANLQRCHIALQGVELHVADALQVGERARRGDLVYFDPPYDPVSPTASFTAYTRGGFGRVEQERLAAAFDALARRGVHVVLSNSDTPFIRQLYAGFQIDRVHARRAINSRASRRGPVGELLITVPTKGRSKR